jgi:hypothetical protein
LKGYPGLCEPLNQRLAMYMVISKPKRMSTNDGVVHCMKYPPFALLKCTWALALGEEPGSRRFSRPHGLISNSRALRACRSLFLQCGKLACTGGGNMQTVAVCNTMQKGANLLSSRLGDNR